MKLRVLAGCVALGFAVTAPAQSVVITNARIIDGTGKVIEHGCADIVIVAGDPLEDIFNLTRVVLVVKDGKVVSDKRGKRQAAS